ncbi:MAG: CvpA family protein [Arenicellales bacterium]|nr:CvpA family protein [Arenicellales bacterium]MDP6434570.1 CvpA family protein [Arenicellales bacterium]MDP6672725.1 CvpA family protein [Arenicellales bacterium]MDP6724261.1 CvpA family protein [Arenicellales bacterium]
MIKMPLDIFDLVIIGVILFSAIIGLFRGFIRETLSLVSWILAFVAAFNYRLDIISWFDGIIDNQMYQQIAAFALIFVATLLLISIISHLIYRLMSSTGITGIDRVLGLIFGFGRGVLLLGFFVIISRTVGWSDVSRWETSQLAGYLDPVVEILAEFIPEDLPKTIKGE